MLTNNTYEHSDFVPLVMPGYVEFKSLQASLMTLMQNNVIHKRFHYECNYIMLANDTTFMSANILSSIRMVNNFYLEKKIKRKYKIK